jgi:hypothetical protein
LYKTPTPFFFPSSFFSTLAATLLFSIVAVGFCQNSRGGSPFLMYGHHQLVLRLLTTNSFSSYHFHWINLAFCDEFDEDITKVDMHESYPSASYKSSSTWTRRSVRIQQTTLDEISHISLIRYRNEAFFDALKS